MVKLIVKEYTFLSYSISLAAVRRQNRETNPRKKGRRIFLSILNAIFLGFVQGVAEFLTISSSGHLAVLQNVFNLQTAEEGHMFFDVFAAFSAH